MICGWLVPTAAVTGREATADQSPDGVRVPADEHRDRFAMDVAASKGFVLVDGVYLTPPYHVCAAGDSVLINDRIVRSFARRNDKPVDAEDQDPALPTQAQRRSERAAALVARQLRRGAILVAFRDRSPVLLENLPEQFGFYEALVHCDVNSESFRDLLGVLSNHRERRLWTQWLTTYAPSAELQSRATIALGRIRAVESANRAGMRAVLRLQFIAYPLSVIGMMLVVAALGHLLSAHPGTGRDAHAARPEAIRATVISIGLIAVFSLVDLVWTILAVQAGQMRELNPLGRLLIPDPRLLVAFKLAATLVGCGLLYWLRRHARARIAAWWLCLLCTVLLLRWVIFHSMFIA
jgi:hypothetical protein